MKAIIVREFGEPEVMKLEEVSMPEPSGSQVLVQIKAAGVNPVDTYLRTGNHAHAPKLPYTPGKDGAGVVAAIGETVTKFEPGDRVYTAGSISGTYAEFSLCDESHLGRLPDNVSFEAGAGIWTPYATSYRALFQKAKAKSGETVLIHGASGGVGIAAVQWAKNRGSKVIGTAGSEEGRRLVKESGADIVIDHLSAGMRDEGREMSEAGLSSSDSSLIPHPSSLGVDIILEMLANVNLQKDFEVLKMFGRIVVIGNRGSLEFDPRAAMSKDAAIYGMSLFNSPQEQLDEIHAAIFDGLSKGFLKPVIGKTFPLAEAPQAHHAVLEQKAFGKIVLACR